MANGTVEAEKADNESEKVFDPEKDKEHKGGEDDTTATLGRADGEPEDELGADMKGNEGIEDDAEEEVAAIALNEQWAGDTANHQQTTPAMLTWKRLMNPRHQMMPKKRTMGQ